MSQPASSEPLPQLAGAKSVAAPTAPAERAARLVSLDAYRGLIMVLLVSRGLGFADVAQHVPGAGWSFLGRQVDHSAWLGCTLWD